MSSESIVSIVDYGMANLGSMSNMFRKIGIASKVVKTASEIENSERIILPGVGAFDHGMDALKKHELVEPIKNRAKAGIPILGVCLGMQMLGRGSEEGEAEGLNLVDAYCERLNVVETPRLKVPHMGWCQLIPKRDSALLQELEGNSRFYFVHSYHMKCADEKDLLATSQYGVEFTAMVQKGNIMGAQFHPEKSHRFGMQLLRNFSKI